MVTFSFSSEFFNVKDTLECGQIFSYKKIGENYIVYSADKIAEIFPIKNGYFIKCKNRGAKFCK